MKALIPKLIVILTIFISANALTAAPPVRGLVLFDEPPATYVQILEFASIRESNIRYSAVVLPNGQKREIPRDGILATIEYPPQPPETVSDHDAGAITQKIQNLIQAYPQYRLKLDAALSKWQNALAFSQKNRKSTAQTTPAVSGPILEIDGAKYRDVALTAFTGTEVAITHSDGVATIPAVKLTTAQIAVLNATSASVRIDPAQILKQPPTGTPVASRSTGTPAPIAAAAQPAETVEIARLKQAVSTTEATLKKLQAEEADIHSRMGSTPNRAKNTPEFLQMSKRITELNDLRQQAQFRVDAAVQNLRNGEQAAFAKVQKAKVEEYRASATLPLDPHDWEAVVKAWTDQVAEQTKIAEAAKRAAHEALLKRIYTPEEGLLSVLESSESEKLEIAKTTLARAKKRATESAADKTRLARIEETRMEEKKHTEDRAEALQRFRSLPVNAEAFIIPPVAIGASPSYAETIEFLDDRFGFKIGFGEQSRKLIIRYEYGGATYVFDPKDMNPEIIISTSSNDSIGVRMTYITVVLACRNAQLKIEQFTIGGDRRMTSQIPISMRDSIEAEKLSKALSHLVSILGAKKEVF